jgi:hypothetical protein
LKTAAFGLPFSLAGRMNPGNSGEAFSSPRFRAPKSVPGFLRMAWRGCTALKNEGIVNIFQ